MEEIIKLLEYEQQHNCPEKVINRLYFFDAVEKIDHCKNHQNYRRHKIKSGHGKSKYFPFFDVTGSCKKKIGQYVFNKIKNTNGKERKSKLIEFISKKLNV